MCYGMLNFGCVEQWVITIIGGEYNRLRSNILCADEQKAQITLKELHQESNIDIWERLEVQLFLNFKCYFVWCQGKA